MIFLVIRSVFRFCPPQNHIRKTIVFSFGPLAERVQMRLSRVRPIATVMDVLHKKIRDSR